MPPDLHTQVQAMTCEIVSLVVFIVRDEQQEYSHGALPPHRGLGLSTSLGNTESNLRCHFAFAFVVGDDLSGRAIIIVAREQTHKDTNYRIGTLYTRGK